MRVPECNGVQAPPLTGLADSVLSEIAQALQAFAQTGEGSAIDLRSIPMTDADRAVLEQRLGHGEVEVTLNVAGKSEIWETGYAGVWWVRHRGADARIAAETIIINTIPQILQTHKDDAEAAAARLARAVAAMPASEHKEDANHV